MSVLSTDTVKLIHILYVPEDVQKVCLTLEKECGTEVLSCPGWSPIQMERIRFAVIKLDKEKTLSLNNAITLAKKDWRDLLILAGFADEVDSYKKWVQNYL